MLGIREMDSLQIDEKNQKIGRGMNYINYIISESQSGMMAGKQRESNIQMLSSSGEYSAKPHCAVVKSESDSLNAGYIHIYCNTH
jgi:hypothetical protein